MIFMQAPMALYSLRKWHGKKKETEAIMKKMDRRELSLMVVGAIVLFVIMTGILSAINGAFNANVLFDTFFLCLQRNGLHRPGSLLQKRVHRKPWFRNRRNDPLAV